ncbi:heterokaryon incompatibility protein-domain-containing protein [Aspergillus avenaceus]|uniref:Heterokaryon incompatibility protein-domain-containing protein n=1 Tax=Aspergillus avenaceus TaxID=36643 RepID=A0A5N6U2H1_ASPAV|nr:heterokaryon incompatibility protein-domain-containing protein [Aspergillus avenaceus]
MPEHLDKHPLIPDRRDIRLLRLLPASTPEAPIECTLQVASLDDSPQFETVSYVWGNVLEKGTILVDDCTLEVILNVEKVLRRIRRPEEARVVWMDFVCINQESIEEKNVQVPLMGAIYASASSVIAIVSLDNLSGNVEGLIEWIEARGTKKPTWKAVSWLLRALKSKISLKARCELMAFVLHAKVFARDFLIATYWTRMWTFQEFQLAQNDSVCICGDTELQGTYAKYVLGVLLHPISGVKRGITRRWGIAQLQNSYAELETRLQELDNEIREIALDKGFPFDAGQFKPKDRDLILLLPRTVRRECTDPKDKIFALYSLLPSLQAAYPMDYRKPLKQIMHETTKFHIEQEGSLMILRLCPLREDRLEDTSIPSWVPDLTLTLPFNIALVTNDGLEMNWRFSWSRRIDVPKLTQDSSTLQVWAWAFGTCKIAFRFKYDRPGIVSQIADILKMDDNPSSAWNLVWGRETIPDRFLRACLKCTNNFTSFTGLSEDDIPELSRDLRELATFFRPRVGNPPERLMRVDEESLSEFLRRLAGKTVFFLQNPVTTTFGISDSAIEEEDRVIVGVLGMVNPVVLRQDHSMHESSSQVYNKIVGLAYIDGILEHDSPKTSTILKHFRKLPVETFLLR